MMFTIPAFLLALVIFWKEWLLWRFHRTMPLWLRAASVIPGVLLGLLYVVFGVYDAMHQALDLQLRSDVARVVLFAFFFWNAIVLLITQDQHRKDLR